MNCFPCFSSQRSKKSTSKREHASPQDLNEPRTPEMKKQKPTVDNKDQNYQVDSGNIAAETFTFRELATATKNFRQECLLGEGGFGRVYKGVIQRTGQVVAVKQLDRNGMDGNKEFLSEVLSLSLIHHDNLVNLIGYCADGDQRLLVYEYMPMGSLEDHLLEIKPKRKPLDWIARMKIAYGAAQGLEYLHDKVNPPVIYQDLKSSSVLLDEELHPKLSDLGLAKVCPSGNKMPLSSRALGTYGYSAPEYSRGDHLSVKADVYSFGVVLLEIITGRRAVDTTRPNEEQNLVTWAQPIFKDPSKFSGMADPLLKKRFPERDLNQVVAIAAMCLQEEAAARPLMSDVVTALSFLSMVKEEDIPAPLPEKDTKPENSNSAKYEDEDSSTDSDGENSDHQSLNSSFSLDGESVHKENGKQVVRKSKKLGSNSKSKNQERSPDKSTLSSRKSSMSSEEMNHSSRPENRKGSDGESASSGDESSKGSHGLSQRSKNGLKNENVTLSRKSSKNLFLSFAHKSSEKSQDDDTFSISSDSSDGSVSSSCKSERKSLDGREYSSRHHKSSSKRSSSRGASLKHKNSKGSQKENVSLDHDSSDESQEDGSVYSS